MNLIKKKNDLLEWIAAHDISHPDFQNIQKDLHRVTQEINELSEENELIEIDD